MKSKNILSDIRGKSAEEHAVLVTDLREKHRLARLDLARGRSKNPQLSRQMKKDIARILTVSRESRTR